MSDSPTVPRCGSILSLQCLLIGFLCSAGLFSHADWPQFRGNNSNGIGTGSAPVKFGPETNVQWKTDLDPGHSSPCVAGDRIFLTTSQEDDSTVSVVCLNRLSGDILWQRPLKVERFEKGHPAFDPASSSPCCDDTCVVAYFGSYGLVCFDHAGRLLWERRLPMTKSFGGNATSPMIAGDRVLLYRGNYVDHYLLCVSKQDGSDLWKIPQSERFTGEMACTSCPIIVGERLICHTARSVQCFNVNSGQQLWIAQCATTATSTPVIVGNEVIVAAWNKLGEADLRPPFPSFAELVEEHDQDSDQTINKSEFPKLWIFHRPEGIEAALNGAPVSFRHADKNKDQQIDASEWKRTVTELEKFRAGYETHGLLAIPIESEGFVPAGKVRTLASDGIPEVPSPVSDGKNVYVVKNGGILTGIDVATEKRLFRTRTRGSGTHYASPLICDGRMYCVAGNGDITVVQIGDRAKILTTNRLNESVYASPAVVEGVLYVRTHSALYAFANQE